MPSRPPETTFYHDDDNATLWRTLSREFEEFVERKVDGKERFVTVVEDMMVRLRENSERLGGQ